MRDDGQRDHADQLTAMIRDVRSRWRTRLLVRGLLITVIGGALLLLGASVLLDTLRFRPEAVVALRVASLVAIGLLAAWSLVRPLQRRVTDAQVALYIEEHDPALDALLLGAMSASGDAVAQQAAPDVVRRLVEEAVVRCQAALDGGRAIDLPRVRRYAGWSAVAAAVAIAVFVLGPPFLRQALQAMFSFDVQATAPYRITVTPGSRTIPRGSDQTITAALSGFTADEAVLLVRRGAQPAFERAPIVAVGSGRFEAMVFDIGETLEYAVEAGGVRSATYRLEAVDLPAVRRLALEYHFPAYTGLEPQQVEPGGDIAVLAGTEVRVTVEPTMPVATGQVVVDERPVPLTPGPDDTLVGRFVAATDGVYHVALQGAGGPLLTASPSYVIDVLADGTPSVAISKPGRDVPATPVEEFAIEVRADDDYGVRGLELVYAVNGGPEKRVSLFRGTTRRSEVTAGHTLYLEELGLSPGDAVSYYARATDNDATGAKAATSDLYFLRIRPFDKAFRAATSMAGGGGGGAGGGDVGALSEQQRQVIAGTFNVQRDRRTLAATRLREATVVLALSQGRLREQVEGLAARMGSRLVTPDPAFKKIADLLPQAAAQMALAEQALTRRDPAAALAPEQKALQLLQQAEEEYETQVTTNRNAGGGGGGAGSIAEDLADLFELEKDALANQYETPSRAESQQAEQRLDALAEQLKELARRQLQELERQRRAAQAQGGGAQAGASGRPGASQRALAEQVEQAARQLAQLSREQQRQDLADAARRMQQAADDMRRAASGDPSASAQAASAADRLQQVQRQVQQARADQAGRAIDSALRTAEEIAREHADVAEATTALGQAGASRMQQTQLLAQRRDQLASRVGQLEQELDRSANAMAREQREASRKLQSAAQGVRDEKVKEKLRYSRNLMGRNADPEAARSMDEAIGANLTDLRMALADAASALDRESRGAQAGTPVDRMREAVRSADSLGDRMQEGRGRGEGASEGQGANGQSANGQGGREGQGDAQGQGRDADGAAGGRGFGADDVRQFRGEARRLGRDLGALRQSLRAARIEARDLDAVLSRLRALEDERAYRDADEIARLQTQVREGLRRFEFLLRRQLEAGTDVLQRGTEEVPAEFRALVEEYYRALAGQKDRR